MTQPTAPKKPDLPSSALGPGHLRAGRARASIAGVAWSLVNVLAGTGITMLVFVVTSRILPPSDFGIVALSLSIAMLISCLVPFGFGEALVQRQDLTEKHLSTVFWLCGVAGVVAYGALVLNAGLIAGWAGTTILEPMLAFIGLRIVFDGFAVVPFALLHRQMQYRAFAIRTLIASGTSGALCLAMIWAGYGLWALATVQVASPAINLLVVAMISGWRPRASPDAGALRDLRAFGLAASGTRAIHEARLDQIILGALAGPAVLGLYFFSRRLYQILTDVTVGVFSPVTSVLFASLQSEREKARQVFLTAGSAAMLIGFPLFGGLIVVADTAVPTVFGPQWEDAVFAIRAFSVIGLMAVIGIVQATLINGYGHAGWWLAYQGTSQFLAVPIVLVVYPLWGLDGVMAALVLRTMVLWPLSVRKALVLLDMSLGTYLKSVATPGAVVVLMVAMVGAVPLIAPSLGGWSLLGAELVTGVIAFVGGAFILARRPLLELVTAARRKAEGGG